ncbi:MAG: bacillithiol biosynthesis protein BshC, partial [Saprospiraceae bacterium]
MKNIQADCQYFSFEETNAFSYFDNAYNQQDERFVPFMNSSPSFDSFETLIQERQDFDVNRSIIVQELQRQHAGRNSSSLVLENINLLADKNTFTIITAHQPSLFTGPLYYIYKIISTIKLCKQLKEKFPDKDFIPIYWSGAEDHDFEEINHFRIFGRKIIWKNDEKGSVGKMSNENIISVID